MGTAVENEEIQQEVDEQKREFMKKFGKYAATAPLGMYLLMGPGASKAQASGSVCSKTGSLDWGVCTVTNHITYEASGSKTGSCTINVETTFVGNLTLDVENQETVTVTFPDGDHFTLGIDFVESKLDGYPIYTILSQLGIIS